MYTVGFADGEYETFGCLACGMTFVSKRAIERHFDRNPSHENVTITGSNGERGPTRFGDDGVRRGVARRRLIERLARDATKSPPETENDAVAKRARNADTTGKKNEKSGERSR